jgi:PP-loop superfamily ATP-utilizing enzyme
MGEQLDSSLPAKLKKLKSILKTYPGVVIAFSGGVDSSSPDTRPAT